MSAASFRIPPNVWVEVTNPTVIEQARSLINAHIRGEPLLDKECTEINIASLQDLPKDIGLPVPGNRHFEMRVTTAAAVIHFIVGVAGSPGSEILGYTGHELDDAIRSVRVVIRDLRAGGKPAKDSVPRLEEIERMLEHPTFDPERWQTIGEQDFVHVMAFGELNSGARA